MQQSSVRVVVHSTKFQVLCDGGGYECLQAIQANFNPCYCPLLQFRQEVNKMIEMTPTGGENQL